MKKHFYFFQFYLIVSLTLSSVARSDGKPFQSDCYRYLMVADDKDPFDNANWVNKKITSKAELSTERQRYLRNYNSTKNGEAKTFSVSYVEELDTIRTTLTQTHGVLNLKPQVVFLMLHGFGVKTSSSWSFKNILTKLGTSTVKSPSKSAVGVIQQLENWIPGIVEAFDLPGSRFGSWLEDYDTAQKYTDYIEKLVLYTQALHPGLPIYVISRSASPVFAEQAFNQYYKKTGQKLFQAASFFSPTALGDSRLSDFQQYMFAQDAKKSQYKQEDLNHQLLEFYFKETMTLPAWTSSNFKNFPLLIMTGNEDLQVTGLERGLYSGFGRSPGSQVKHVHFPKLGHALLDIFGDPSRDKNFSFPQWPAWEVFYHHVRESLQISEAYYADIRAQRIEVINKTRQSDVEPYFLKTESDLAQQYYHQLSNSSKAPLNESLKADHIHHIIESRKAAGIFKPTDFYNESLFD